MKTGKIIAGILLIFAGVIAFIITPTFIADDIALVISGIALIAHEVSK